MTTPTDPSTVGPIPRDLLPAVKPIVAVVLMNIMWSIANGVDWNQAVASAVLLAGQWIAPEWNPPRSAAKSVLARLQPGHQVGADLDLVVIRPPHSAAPGSGQIVT